MRVKDPSSYVIPEKMKRDKKPKKPPDEDSSDDVAGLTCQHVSRAVDVNRVKRAVAQNVWSICAECLKERKINNGEPVSPMDIWLCLKCGHQGCSRNVDGQHSLKHFQVLNSEPHCIVINLSTWIIWCYDCNEQLSTHCNKKSLAQMVDFLQKHASRAETGSSAKVIHLCEEDPEACGISKTKVLANNTSVPVKGINNLGNTCFFNAVIQNLAQTHMLNELMHEMKEKGTKLKICHSVDTQLDPLVVNLSSPGPLTSAMFLFLHSMKEAGKSPLSPKVLFGQLCQKAPRFKAFQQQDSQELLHYLLDSMRIEETKRIQSGILRAFNNPTTKTADEETKRKVKAYGREGVKMNFIERIFVGELTSTVMCEECEHISTVKEPFIDLSLPIIEERVSKPVPLGRTSKGKNVPEADIDHHNCTTVPSMNNQQPELNRKHSLAKDKNLLNHERSLVRTPSGGDEERSPVIMQEGSEAQKTDGGCATLNPVDKKGIRESAMMGSQSDGSERGEGSHSESNMDADSEASDCESTSKQTVPRSAMPVFMPCAGNVNDLPVSGRAKDCGSEMLADTVSNLCIHQASHESTGFCAGNLSPGLASRPILSQSPQTSFQTLSQAYVTSSKECSIQSCLYHFTSVELLVGNNKLLCETCTERRQKYQKKTDHTEKRVERVYTNARKQLLISTVPAILILHLKRFHQAGFSLRKVNRHVDFPLTLDLAPFCSASCKESSRLRTEGMRRLMTMEQDSECVAGFLFLLSLGFLVCRM
ncbi:ubiquitin carboxyl-terminal hydrolase 45 isoform X2 [Microcaecilia unicolor]|uniref:Ubiquitin carboxyl-terminal hydrolase 45 n=1 Tax=Microcaecilia unicolor TaxID=1415580 RepID=A0A6P7XR78_9AMPH|nr:ubiquitin carboxyl-terminal hydrolase 45 isoform X2 [Microcaecilia unicolor]XP_030055018.1 ubiquitin carboxyl-terminal hydrolase 45 isoform X2 [Microcaecilia unicolor]